MTAPSINPPEFSVVIRCYNRRDRIANAIESVLAQSHQDFEIIVVDDASTDGSAEWVAERFGNNSKIRLECHDTNRGAGAAANTGVAAANGDVIAFLDSDDCYLADCLGAHRAALASAPTAVMTYCDYVQVWDPHNLERVMSCGTDQQDQRFATLRGGFIHSQSLIAVRREALSQVGPFDDTLAISHDFDLWMRLALAYEQPFFHVAQPLVRYALSADGVTKRYEQWWDEAKTVLGRGRAHVAAAPYLDALVDVDRRVGANIIARRAVEHWIDRVKPQTVTVVIPVFQNVESLDRALSSVRDQTVTDLEILIVTDKTSAEKTHRILARFDDCRVSLLEVGDDNSRTAAMAKAMRLGDGPLIAFLDPQDEWDPTYLENQLRANSFAAEKPVFTYADIRFGGVDGQSSDGTHEHRWKTSDPLEEYARTAYPHSLSCLVVRSELARAITLSACRIGHEGADIAAACFDWLSTQDEFARQRQSPVRIARPLVTLHRSEDDDNG